MVWYDFLDYVFGPLLKLGPFLTVLILAIAISFLITLVYKYFTNQEKMKGMKEKQKEYQKRMKELRDNPQEMMKVQKEAMKINLEYMKSSFKPTLITMIPILLIFGWMSAHLSYEPIYPGETYSITATFIEGVKGEAELIVDQGTELTESPAKQEIKAGQAIWNLRSNLGEHTLTIKSGSEEQKKTVLITKELNAETPLSVYDHSAISKININYNKLKPLGEFSIFGWQPGWLGIYIFFSIVTSILFRKLLNIY